MTALVFLLWLMDPLVLGLQQQAGAAPARPDFESLSLTCSINPGKRVLNGVARLDFTRPHSEWTLNLAGSFRPFLAWTGRGEPLALRREEGKVVLSGNPSRRVLLHYKGKFPGALESIRKIGIVFRRQHEVRVDHFLHLTRVQDFFPYPSCDFSRVRLAVNLPGDWNCLASGTSLGNSAAASRTRFVFESHQAKGFSLSCGRFHQLRAMPGVVAVRIFGAADFDVERIVPLPEVREMAALCSRLFGALDVPEICILFQRWYCYGGTSSNGFITCLIDARRIGRLRRSNPLPVDSPLYFHDPLKDVLCHKIAHQWWGSLVSWRTPADMWITDGLATYSTLVYLQHSLKEAEFQRICRNLCRWVAGLPEAGEEKGRNGRHARDLHGFQTRVYCRPALTFLMLADLIGEEELWRRMRGILVSCRYRSLTTREFMGLLGRGDERLGSFMRGWICGRSIPRIEYSLRISGSEALLAFRAQPSAPAVPMRIRIRHGGGEAEQTVLIERESQEISLRTAGPIRSVGVDSPHAPVHLLARAG